jgi:hypothetical protein
MASPHWRVWIDWDADGVWGESNEDVTSDLMELHWEWGWELDRDRARPARLYLALRNDDHKYSPPNSGSPLSGNLKAGRQVWAQLAYPYDDFTGSDSADLSGRSVPVDSNFAWVKENGGANGFEIPVIKRGPSPAALTMPSIPWTSAMPTPTWASSTTGPPTPTAG